MMYIQSRKRKMLFPFSSCLSNSFVFSSPHFPFNLNCQSNCKRKKPTHSEDPNSGVSSSLTAPHGRDHERGDELPKGNTYEVFLSFRGIDTHKNFTDYLYTSLIDAGIHVFRDDDELRVGEEIGPEFLRNITQSTISIPIISENYVSSKWCLRELVQMLECKRSKGQIVLPIFYKVEPSQVRHPTGRLREAIDEHKKNMEEMVVKEWEEALKEVSSLKGWESEKIDNGHEGALVKIVVTKVLSELKGTFQLIVPQQLVGIDDHIEHIMSLIDAKFNGTWIIGIYGMGGIGKTTLAKVLYNKFLDQFEHHSFVADCREAYRHEGIKCLQRQLISSVGRPCDVFNVDKGIHLIKSRFAHKKTLIFLDDIDDSAHLKYLVDRNWFKVGSIIIITTRNKDVLDQASANHTYQLNKLSFNQSLILFSRHAFQKDSPPSDYEDISHDVISTTGGLPLALEVIGSFLCRKRENVWKDTLKKLEKIPDKKVQETLKISYEALDHEEKQIFLDIACIFIGSSKQNPTYMWDACGFFPERGIEVLSLMSLIKIDGGGKLMMHDQLRDLGREIVRLENPNEPQERSRLWIYEEALDVLDNNEGTKKIEVLSLGKCGKGKRYAAKQFKKLTNLRLLEVDGANFTGDFQSVLPKLRVLLWKECPSDFIVTNFHLKKLTVLDLADSAISEDWGGWVPLKVATELKLLSLNNCRSLKRTPDLFAFKRLENLYLNNCTNLEELHPSIGNLTSLIKLQLEWTSIMELPKSIGNLQNLRVLSIQNSGITKLPDDIGMLAKLEVLNARDCKHLERLPSNICKLISLRKLYVGICEKLRELPELPSGLTDLEIGCQGQSLPHLSQITRLKILYLNGCRQLECVPELPIGLSELMIARCGKLKALTTNLLDLKHLRQIGIYESPPLEGSLDTSNFMRTQMRELGLKEVQDPLRGLSFYRQQTYTATGGRREGGLDVHGISLSL